MDIFALNINNSIRNLYNETSQRFSRIGLLITQIWDRIMGNKQPKETFISYKKDHDFKLVKPTVPEDTTKVDFDEIKREFDSLQVRNAIDNKESVFFEDDFVSTSDWADTALQFQEALYSYIKPIIEEYDIQKEKLTSQLQEELERVNEELNQADKAEIEQSELEIQCYYDRLKNLEKEKQEDLQSQLTALEEEFNISKQRIFNFQSLTEKLADQYKDTIAQNNEKYNIQSKKLSNIAKNLVKQRKKFASSTAKESLERLTKDFEVRSLKIHKEIELKYIEKEKNVDETLEENLSSLQEDVMKAKQVIKELSDEKINSITSKIENLHKNLTMTLSSVNNKNEEVDTSFEEDEPLLSNFLKEGTLQESELTTDSIEQSANPLELFLEISLEKDTSEEKETPSEDSLMTTIYKTYNLLWENLSGALTNSYSFSFHF